VKNKEKIAAGPL